MVPGADILFPKKDDLTIWVIDHEREWHKESLRDPLEFLTNLSPWFFNPSF